MVGLIRGLVPPLLAVALALALPGLATAQAEVRQVGQYELAVGWRQDPALAGAANAVRVVVTDLAGQPVEGLAGSLWVEISEGSQTSRPSFLAAGATPGEYESALTPTRPGSYTFHLLGVIRGQPVDQSFSSFGVVKSRPGVGSRAPTPGASRRQGATLQEELAVAGIVAGAIVFLALVVAASRHRWATEPVWASAGAPDFEPASDPSSPDPEPAPAAPEGPAPAGGGAEVAGDGAPAGEVHRLPRLQHGLVIAVSAVGVASLFAVAFYVKHLVAPDSAQHALERVTGLALGLVVAALVAWFFWHDRHHDPA